MAKVFLTAKIGLADLAKVRHRCAWKGCTATLPSLDPLPKDWRWLAVWWDKPRANPNPFRADVRMDRDAVLCPKHWRELDGLLEDIGQRLGETKGSA